MNDHPADVYTFLDQLQNANERHKNDPAYYAQLFRWLKDTTGTEARPEHSRGYELLEHYCVKHGLAADTPAVGGGVELTITLEGRLALRLHNKSTTEQAPATTPAAPTAPPTPDPTTIVYQGGQSYSDGAEARCVDQQYHDVLQAFMKTPRPMKTRELEQVVSNPSKVIKQLKQWFPGAVDVPGPDKGKGYMVRVKSQVSCG